MSPLKPGGRAHSHKISKRFATGGRKSTREVDGQRGITARISTVATAFRQFAEYPKVGIFIARHQSMIGNKNIDVVNSQMPRFSIILAIHNQEKTLADALSALLAMKIPRESFEIIAVDNNSQDGSMAILRRTPGIRILSEPKPTPLDAKTKQMVREAYMPFVAEGLFSSSDLE